MRVLTVRRVRRYARPRYRGAGRGRGGRRGVGASLAAGAAGAAAALFLGAAGQGCFYQGCPLPPGSDGGGEGSDSAVVVPPDSAVVATDSGWMSPGGMAMPLFLTDAEAEAIFRETMEPALVEAGHGGCLAQAETVSGEGYSFEADDYCAELGVGFEYLAYEEVADPDSTELGPLAADESKHMMVEDCWLYSWDETWPDGEQVARDALRDRVLEFIDLLKSQGVI